MTEHDHDRRMRRWSHILVLCVVATCLLVVIGCAQPLSPQDVTERFWRAVVTGHPGKIRKYVIVGQREHITEDTDLLPVAAFKLGRAVIDLEQASIETSVTLAGDPPLTININTNLIRQDNRWRVDYEATVAEISTRSNLAHVIEQIGNLGSTLQEGIDRSVEELSQVVPAIERELSRIESEIKQRMPELREKLDAFSKRIDEALKVPPPASPDAPARPVEKDATIAL